MADHWIENHKRDSWRRQAKSSGYRARSAFKLLQIQEKFKLIREGDVIPVSYTHLTLPTKA